MSYHFSSRCLLLKMRFSQLPYTWKDRNPSRGQRIQGWRTERQRELSQAMRLMHQYVKFPINSIQVANGLGKFDKMKPTYKLQPLNGVHIADDGLVELFHSVHLFLFIHLQKVTLGNCFSVIEPGSCLRNQSGWICR